MFGTVVSVDELARHLDDPAWVIVDCRHLLQDFEAGRRMYAAAHIPRAFHAHGEEDVAGRKTGKNGRHPLPDVDEFIAFLRDMGVNANTQIVAYDAGADMWASRFWYLCKYVGHEAVAVLDGGFAAWAGMQKPVSAHVPKRPRNGTIEAHVREDLAVDAQDVLEAIDSKSFSLIDARGADRFQGQNETVDPVGGHIPGATNRPFRSNFTGPFGQFKKAEELRAEFEAIGIPPEQVVHQCGSGVSAAVNMLAMAIAGFPQTRLYPGSWSEWSSDPSRPMVTAT